MVVSRALAVLCLGAALSGCVAADVPRDPDRELARCVELWEEAKEEQTQPKDRGEVPDPTHLQARFERLALEFPEHEGTLYANAVVASDAGQHERAQQYLDRLFRRQPVHPDGAVLRARIAVQDGNLPHARRVLERQATLAPDHAGVHEALAGVLYLQGELLPARQELGVAARLGAPGWRVAYHLGLVAEGLGALEEAAHHYQVAIDRNPGFEPARARLLGLSSRRP
ncbi:MAG: tetratricopeptide repeat protein [Planctomycetes bacterium]|nr:tetratricopeptide repeat protein [Planctomycetota bacterium]